MNESVRSLVSPRTNWRQKVSKNNSQGTPYNGWKGRIRTVKDVSDDAVKNDINPTFGVSSNDFRKDHMAFANSGRTAMFTVDYIDQGEDGANAWTTFVLECMDNICPRQVRGIYPAQD